MLNELYTQLVVGVLMTVWGSLTVTTVADSCEKYITEDGWCFFHRDGTKVLFKGERAGLIVKRWTQLIGLVLIVLGVLLICQVALK